MAGTGRGGDALNAVYSVDCLLDGLGDFGLNRFRRRTRIGRQHRNDGELYVGILLDRQAAIGRDAEDQDCHHDHGGKDRMSDANGGKGHGSVPLDHDGRAVCKARKAGADDDFACNNAGPCLDQGG